MEEAGLGFWLLRIAASIAGVLLIYAAAFTYPEERRGLHSKLEDWWLHLHDMSDAALRRHVAFIRKTASTAKAGFDWLFGEALSTRFFYVSGFLSMGSFVIGMLSFGDYGWAVPTGLALFTVGIVAFAFIMGGPQDRLRKQLEDSILEKYGDDPLYPSGKRGPLFSKQNITIGYRAPDWPDLQRSLASLASYEKKKAWWEELLSPEGSSRFLMPVLLASIAFSSTGLVFSEAKERGVDEGVFFLSLFTAFVCDAVCVLITVYFLEKISTAKSAVVAAAYFLIDALVAGAMLIIPWILFARVVEPDTTLAHYLIFVAAANLSTLVPSVVFLLVALTALAHRLFWPVLLRPFYNLIHAEKIMKPKTLGLAGLACFTVWLDIPESYQAFFKNLMNQF